jgi:Zn-dependent peptidase ImmA (M78 family)
MKKVIKLNIFNCKVNFILSKDIIKDVQKIFKKNKEVFELDCELEGIVFYFTISEYFIIINENYLTHNTLAHEIYHLVVKVTEPRDITDEEAQSWLCGELTQDIYKFLETNKILIK